jgi:hypothetical protein
MHMISYVLVVIVALIFLYTGYYGCNCCKKESFEDLDVNSNLSKLTEMEKNTNSSINKLSTIQSQNKKLLQQMNSDTKEMLKSLENL